MDGFTNRLDEINKIADESPGFIWRLQTESGNATDIRPTDNPLLIINMSVWKNIESLFRFAYRSEHKNIFGDRSNWFETANEAYQALWWIPEGHIPDPMEGMKKLSLLQKNGPGPDVFTFRNRFMAPE